MSMIGSTLTGDVLTWWMFGSLAVCLGALALASVNLSRFRTAPHQTDSEGWTLTVCIPARNEASNLEDCVRSVLAAADDDPASRTRVMVYDDGSEDETPSILARLVREDDRVEAAVVKPLPEGWNGKQHACDCMGRQAQSDWVLFTDADVRFTPDSLRRTRAEMRRAGRSERPITLLSAFPRERTGSLGEALVVPLIHVILLSYLPMGRMRRTLDPAASAACGQFILCDRAAWLDAGGHAAIRESMHDGVRLPRIFRSHGHATDIFDGTDIVSCRMYRGFAETWSGFAKNAYEGLGNPILLGLLTVLHIGGHVAPWLLILFAIAAGMGVPGFENAVPPGFAIVLAVVAIACQFTLRFRIASRFSQSTVAALLHPIGLVLLTIIQWWSFRLHVSGQRSWRGRVAKSTAIT